MVVEFEVINSYPVLDKGVSCARYIPRRTTQKKLFTIENMEVEEYSDFNGRVCSRYCTTKYGTDYYRLNIPYETMKTKYFMPIEVKGLGK